MTQQDQQSLKYFVLIEKVGSHHKYQLIVLILMVVINMLQMAAIFMMPYLLHQNNYTCYGLATQQCNQFVCKLGQNQRNDYLSTSSPFSSLADQIGNFRCEKSHQLTTLQSLIFIGGITGMCIFSLFTQRIGRKISMLLSLIIFLIGLIIIFFSKSIMVLGIGIFICFAGSETVIQYSVCYATEVVAQSYRFKFTGIVAFTDSFGIILNSLAYYTIKDWRIVFFTCYIIPTIITILGVIYYIQDTPIDLLSKQSSPQILQVLKKIAKLNNVENPQLNIETIQALKKQYRRQSKKQAFNLVDLCRFKSLRTILAPLVIANFFSNYLFYAPSFIQKSISQDLFLDNIISGISKMASVVFVYYSLTRLSRKKVLLFLSSSIFIFSLMMTLQAVKKNGVFKFIIYFIFRMKVCVLQSVTFMLNYESFPAQIRATAAIICYLIGGEGSGIAQPWMNKAAENIKIPYSYIFAAFSLANFINSFFLRETLGVTPPEIIQQLHHISPCRSKNQQKNGQFKV